MRIKRLTLAALLGALGAIWAALSRARVRRLVLPVLLSVLLLASILSIPTLLSRVLADSGEPPAGTVVGIATYTFYPTTALSGSAQTVYSASPYYDTSTSPRRDVTWVKSWNSADVFVIADLEMAEALTVTAQHSPDGESWADAWYPYVSDGLSQTTTVITGTEGMTATSTTSSSSSIAEQTRQVVLSADGTKYMRLPIAGEYLRFKMEYSGTVTPTIQVTLRNNGGARE